MKMSKIKIATTLGILCLILTTAISIQLKTMEKEDSEVTISVTNNDLRNQVLKWKEKYEKAFSDFENVEKQLTIIREGATQNNSVAIETQEKIKQNNTILGLTDVQGSGIIIKLQDNYNITQSSLNGIEGIENYLVHDSDLKTIINELWNAGAEAISINGQRIVSTTAITCDGNVIKINGEKIGSPFEIKVIGPSDLYGAIARPGGYYEFMGATGVITNIYKSQDITIPKYTGVISTQYITAVQ